MRSLLALTLLTSPLLAQKAEYKHGAAVTTLAFSPGGKTLASGGQDQTIRLWDLANGEPRDLRGHDASITSVTYSRDGKRLASGGRDGNVIIWDAISGKLLRKMVGHERTVLGVSFSPDGKYVASACYDQTVRLWDVESGQSLCEIEAHADAVSCICFAPDGKTLATGGHDRFVKVWWVGKDGKSLKLVHSLREGRRAEVTGLTFCMNGRLLASVTPHGRLRFRDPSRGEDVRDSTVDELTVLSLASSGDGRTLAVAGLGGFFSLCDVATGAPIQRQEEPTTRTHSLAFTPTEGYVGEVRAVALSSTGLLAAIGTKDGSILVRDIGRTLIGKNAPERLTDKDLEALWKDLRDGDASTGYRAAALLAIRPEQSLPFLKERVRVVEQPDLARIEKLIDDLDHPRFPVREKAAAELEKALDRAEGLMRLRLEKQPSLELRRRIERMLQPLDEQVAPPDRLRLGRALQALEHIGTPAAQEIIEKLSRGCPGAWLTEESRLALARLRLPK
jgi:hypothetical protein